MFSLILLDFYGEIEYLDQQLRILIELPQNFTIQKW